MIPANGAYVVSFELGGENYPRPGWFRKPVVAWDHDGGPMIAGRHGLVPAGTIRQVEDRPVISWRIDEDPSPGSQVIPGGGWMVTYVYDDGTQFTQPVVAWQVDSDGTAQPLTGDSDGFVCPDETSDAQAHFWHPDCDPSWRPKADQ